MVRLERCGAACMWDAVGAAAPAQEVAWQRARSPPPHPLSILIGWVRATFQVFVYPAGPNRACRRNPGCFVGHDGTLVCHASTSNASAVVGNRPLVPNSWPPLLAGTALTFTVSLAVSFAGLALQHALTTMVRIPGLGEAAGALLIVRLGTNFLDLALELGKVAAANTGVAVQPYISVVSGTQPFNIAEPSIKMPRKRQASTIMASAEELGWRSLKRCRH